jgi:hypothetical protein
MINQPVKVTKLPEQGVVVVTIKNEDPYSLRPFQTYALVDVGGDGEAIVENTSVATAIQSHEGLVRALRNGSGYSDALPPDLAVDG